MLEEILKEAKWIGKVAQEDWKEKKVRSPSTGRMVKVKSLSPKEQEKYRPKELTLEHHIKEKHEDAKNHVELAVMHHRDSERIFKKFERGKLSRGDWDHLTDKLDKKINKLHKNFDPKKKFSETKKHIEEKIKGTKSEKELDKLWDNHISNGINRIPKKHMSERDKEKLFEHSRKLRDKQLKTFKSELSKTKIPGKDDNKKIKHIMDTWKDELSQKDPSEVIPDNWKKMSPKQKMDHAHEIIEDHDLVDTLDEEHSNVGERNEQQLKKKLVNYLNTSAKELGI